MTSFFPPDEGDSRHLVERAKGALMLQFGFDSHQAFALLLRWSRQHDLTVPELARVLVLGVVEEDPTTLATDAALVRWLEDRLTRDLVDAVLAPAFTGPVTVTAPRRQPHSGGKARGRHSRS